MKAVVAAEVVGSLGRAIAVEAVVVRVGRGNTESLDLVKDNTHHLVGNEISHREI